MKVAVDRTKLNVLTPEQLGFLAKDYRAKQIKVAYLVHKYREEPEYRDVWQDAFVQIRGIRLVLMSHIFELQKKIGRIQIKRLIYGHKEMILG